MTIGRIRAIILGCIAVWVTVGDLILRLLGMPLHPWVGDASPLRRWGFYEYLHTGTVVFCLLFWLKVELEKGVLHFLRRWQTYVGLFAVSLATLPAYMMVRAVVRLSGGRDSWFSGWVPALISLGRWSLVVLVLAAKIAVWWYWWKIGGAPAFRRRAIRY